jgi:hypothetical protein
MDPMAEVVEAMEALSLHGSAESLAGVVEGAIAPNSSPCSDVLLEEDVADLFRAWSEEDMAGLFDALGEEDMADLFATASSGSASSGSDAGWFS